MMASQWVEKMVPQSADQKVTMDALMVHRMVGLTAH
jgi:hypothetical protein